MRRGWLVGSPRSLGVSMPLPYTPPLTLPGALPPPPPPAYSGLPAASSPSASPNSALLVAATYEEAGRQPTSQ